MELYIGSGLNINRKMASFFFIEKDFLFKIITVKILISLEKSNWVNALLEGLERKKEKKDNWKDPFGILERGDKGSAVLIENGENEMLL